MNLDFVKLFFQRIQIFIAAVILICVIAMFFVPKIIKRNTLIGKNEELKIKIANIENDIADLRKKEFLIQNDPDYLEKLARNKLGYTAPNEIIYKFE
ncbi:MAG: hypothetical protein ACD_79C00410G0002 [uncultured bacterium]|nr:MAG: hypothetical protein ACD_79C00410G0002 [uncultured bacterium]